MAVSVRLGAPMLNIKAGLSGLAGKMLRDVKEDNVRPMGMDSPGSSDTDVQTTTVLARRRITRLTSSARG